MIFLRGGTWGTEILWHLGHRDFVGGTPPPPPPRSYAPGPPMKIQGPQCPPTGKNPSYATAPPPRNGPTPLTNPSYTTVTGIAKVARSQPADWSKID